MSPMRFRRSIKYEKAVLTRHDREQDGRVHRVRRVRIGSARPRFNASPAFDSLPSLRVLTRYEGRCSRIRYTPAWKHR